MVSLSLDLSGIINGEQADPDDFLIPVNELKTYLEDVLNGDLAFDALLVGSGGLDASLSAEIDSSTQYFIIPRMTEAQRDAIPSPLASLLVYNTDEDSLDFYDGSAWQHIAKEFSGAAVRAETSGVTVNNATPTILAWNNEDYDSNEMHDTVTDNSRITINKAGVYLVIAQISTTTGVLGSDIFLEIVLNGMTTIAAQLVSGTASFIARLDVQCLYKFAQGDYIEARFTHESGDTESIDNDVSYFAASYQSK